MRKTLHYLILAVTFIVNTIFLSACGTGTGAHMHSLVHHLPVAATCESEGNLEYWYCAECGKYFSDKNANCEIDTAVLPAKGHNWSEWETTYPVSCIYDGSERRTCSTCYYSETRTVTATGHDYSEGWKFDDQTHWQQCKNCDYAENTTSHTFNAGICTVCGYTITYTENLDYELSNDGNYYTVIGRGNADDSFVFIPSEFNGKPVKYIGVSAFENDNKLTGIYFPETIEFIADFAFYNCYNLKRVKMENGLQAIGIQAFKKCVSLFEIEISNKLTAIGQRAFEECNKLKNIYIRDIAKWCEIEFDGEYANPLRNSYRFYLNGEKIEELVIPDNVTAISDYSFYQCGGSLTSIKIGENVKTIGKYAFAHYHTIDITLTDIILGNKVTSIGAYAFSKCSLLTNIIIPDSVTNIGEFAFSDCSSLTNIIIPDSVTNIGEYAFSRCSSLTNVVILGEITAISDYTFCDCYSLTDIILPDSVTNIGECAFDCCYSLTVIILPDNVTIIGNYSFKDCSSLRSITIPESVTIIGLYAFNNCSSLRSITIPESVTEIHYSFSDCTSLTEAYFADPNNWSFSYLAGATIIPIEQLSNTETAANILKNNSLYKRKK